MFLGRLGIYNDSQKAQIQAFISKGGPAYGLLPADTILAILNDNATRNRFLTNPPGPNDWPFNVPEISVMSSFIVYGGDATQPGYNLSKYTTAVNGFGVPYFFGGYYGLMVPASDLGLSLLPNGLINPEYTVSTPDQSFTTQLEPDSVVKLNAYYGLYASLARQGKVQVAAWRWGVSSPDNHMWSYRDPKLITYDHNYGLITPASNVIAPVVPDHSISDILMFIGIAMAMYGVATAIGNLVSGSEALAQSAATPAPTPTYTPPPAPAPVYTPPPVPVEVVTTSASEISTAAQEALREIELANIGGATITQAEAASWVSALDAANLAVPANVSAIASGVSVAPAPTYEAPPAPPSAPPSIAPEPSMSATEISTSGEEALREIEFARLGSVTVTQGEASGWIAALQNAGLAVPSDLAAIASGAVSPSSLPRFSPETAQQFPGANTSTSSTPKAPTSGAGSATSPALTKLLTTGAGLLATQLKPTTKPTTKPPVLNPLTGKPLDGGRSQVQSNNTWIWVLVAGAGIYAMSRKQRK